MIGGLYGWAAIGLVVAGLSGYGAFQYQRAEASAAKQEMAEGQRDRAIAIARDQEAQMAEVLRYQKLLDETVKLRDTRLAQAESDKRKLRGELDGLKNALPQADKSCLDRAIPPAILERLRDR